MLNPRRFQRTALVEQVEPRANSREVSVSASSLSDETSDEDIDDEDESLESLTDQYTDVCFADLAKQVAANYGRDARQCPQEDMEEVWYADAWDDCTFHANPFFLTYLYEFLPAIVSGYLCWLIEGKVAAQNRSLLFPDGFVHNFFVLCAWSVVLVYLLLSPPGSSLFDLEVTFLLVSFRAGSIAAKYAYFPRSYMRLLRTSKTWLTHDQRFRTLGAASHFNLPNTFEYDVMMEISLAALRADVFRELPRHYFQCTQTVAQCVWDFVKEQLSKFDDMESRRGKAGVVKSLNFTGVKASKFGDTQKFIGLGDIDKIEQEVAEGKLRSCIVAYYFAVREYAPTSLGILALLILGALLVALTRPFVRYRFEDTSDDTWVTMLYQVLLTFNTLPAALFFLVYLTYCCLDAWKRNRLCRGVLASIGHRQIRGERLMDGHKDVFLQLRTPDDMMAFWVVQRVLGPELYRGQGIRYNCAYLTNTLLHLLGMFFLVLTSSIQGGLEYSTAAQILVLFFLGVVLVMIATMLASKANAAIGLVQKVIARACLNSFIRGSEKCEEISELADLLNTNFEDVLPIQIFYMPATGDVVSLIWTVLLFFSHIMLKQLSRQFDTIPSVFLDFI